MIKEKISPTDQSIQYISFQLPGETENETHVICAESFGVYKLIHSHLKYTRDQFIKHNWANYIC